MHSVVLVLPVSGRDCTDPDIRHFPERVYFRTVQQGTIDLLYHLANSVPRPASGPVHEAHSVVLCHPDHYVCGDTGSSPYSLHAIQGLLCNRKFHAVRIFCILYRQVCDLFYPVVCYRPGFTQDPEPWRPNSCPDLIMTVTKIWQERKEKQEITAKS